MTTWVVILLAVAIFATCLVWAIEVEPHFMP